jgi:hypothetical protein
VIVRHAAQIIPRIAAEAVPIMTESDLILPVQFLPQSTATPEKRLLLAVLEEAVGTYQRYAFALRLDRRSRAVLADVEAWFASADSHGLYSFVAICDALGLDATYVRSGLGLWADSHRAPEREGYRFPFRRVSGVRHRTNGRAPGVARRADEGMASARRA